jgi:hypothetical protein
MRLTRPTDLQLLRGSAFAGFRFPPDVIVLAVRWYLRFGLSYRDVCSAPDAASCALAPGDHGWMWYPGPGRDTGPDRLARPAGHSGFLGIAFDAHGQPQQYHQPRLNLDGQPW